MLARHHAQFLAELGERQVLRRQCRGLCSAQARRLGEAELLRSDAGEAGQALSQGVEPRELRLHFAQLHRHGVQILLHELARPLRFALLRGEHQLLHQGDLDVGRETDGEPVKARRHAEQQQEREQHRRDQVPRREVQRPGLGQTVRDDDNLHRVLRSLFLPIAPVQPPKIDRYLSADDRLRPVVAKAQEIGALAKLCTEFLPPGLSTQVQAANLRDGELVMLAANPAAAAKLKMLADSLRKFLLRQGSKVSLVSVRVQPNRSQNAPPAHPKASTLTAAGIAELSALYGRLEAGSPARKALAALLQHQGVKPPAASAPQRAGGGSGRAGKGRT